LAAARHRQELTGETRLSKYSAAGAQRGGSFGARVDRPTRQKKGSGRVGAN